MGAEGALLLAQESVGWVTTGPTRSLERREDVPLEIALRILENANSLDARTREELLAAAKGVMEEVRAEEDERLVASMAAAGLDWSATSPLGPVALPELDISLEIEGEAVAGERIWVVATVKNLGGEVLERLQLRLSAPGTAWDGRRIPIGRLRPGEERSGRAPVSIPVWTRSRESEVEIFMECQGVSPRVHTSQLLNYKGAGRANVGITAWLEFGGGDNALDAQAHVLVRNESSRDLEDVRVRILFPESVGIELTDYDAGVDSLGAGESTELLLGLKVLARAGPLPLHFRVTAKDFGRIASWATDLSMTGESVTLSAPRVSILDRAMHIGAGPQVISIRVTDDDRVEHVEVWFRDEKVVYAVGSGPTIDVTVPVMIEPGENRFTVRAFDAQRLMGRASWVVRGVPGAKDPTTDADDL